MTSIPSNCSNLGQSCAAPCLKPGAPCRRAVRTRLEMRAPDRREAISVFLCRPLICGGSVHATMIAERALQALQRSHARYNPGNACYCRALLASGVPPSVG